MQPFRMDLDYLMRVGRNEGGSGNVLAKLIDLALADDVRLAPNGVVACALEDMSGDYRKSVTLLNSFQIEPGKPWLAAHGPAPGEAGCKFHPRALFERGFHNAELFEDALARGRTMDEGNAT